MKGGVREEIEKNTQEELKSKTRNTRVRFQNKTGSDVISVTTFPSDDDEVQIRKV